MLLPPRFRRLLLNQNPVRLVWIAGVSVGVTIAGLLALNASNHYHLTRLDAEQKSREMSALYNQAVRTTLRNVETVMKAVLIPEPGALRSGYAASLPTRFRKLAALLPAARGLVLQEETGAPVLTLGAPLSPEGLSHALEAASPDGFRISPPFSGNRTSPDWQMVVSTAIRLGDRRHLVSVGLSSTDLLTLIDPSDIPENASLGVMTAEGLLYARQPHSATFTGTTVTLPSPVDSTVRIIRFPVAAGLDGIDRMVAMHRIADHPIYTFVTLAAPSITSIWWGQEKRSLAVGVLGLVLLAGLTGIIAVLIRRQQAENRMLESLAATDSLTGLPNRRALLATLEKELARHERMGAPLSVILLDIDHFKRVNDSFGHPGGDRVLRLVADLLARRLRRSDNAGRLGGEEFALVLPDTPLAGARFVAESMRRAFEKEIRAGNADHGWPVTASFGVCQSRTDDTVDRILRRADAVLYAAKETGRNRVIASPAPAVGN